MFLLKMLQNYHFKYKYQILEKKHFWAHVTIESCSMLDLEDIEKIQNFPPCRL